MKQFIAAQAASIAAEVFDVSGEASRLGGEHDQNFRLQTRSNQQYVLKISRGNPDRAHILFQHDILRRLNKGAPSIATPLPLNAVTGDTLGVHGSCPNAVLQCLTWVAGTPYGELGERTPALNRHIGRGCARLSLSLKAVSEPAGLSSHAWDLDRAGEYIEHSRNIVDNTLRQVANRTLQEFRAELRPETSKLPRSVIHGDLNDMNVLVSDDATDAKLGVIDFGDAVFSTTLYELAIACAYGCLNQAQPDRAIQQIIEGHEEITLLSATENLLLPGLIRTRLAMSLSIAAERESREPGNAYWQVSVLPATQALLVLSKDL